MRGSSDVSPRPLVSRRLTYVSRAGISCWRGLIGGNGVGKGNARRISSYGGPAEGVGHVGGRLLGVIVLIAVGIAISAGRGPTIRGRVAGPGLYVNVAGGSGGAGASGLRR